MEESLKFSLFLPLKSDVKIMKFFRYLLFSAVFVFGAVSCKKDAENIWAVEIKEPDPKVEITDISKEFTIPAFRWRISNRNIRGFRAVFQMKIIAQDAPIRLKLRFIKKLFLRSTSQNSTAI